MNNNIHELHPESHEIICNARQQYADGEITHEQLCDVYRMVATAEAEISILQNSER